MENRQNTDRKQTEDIAVEAYDPQQSLEDIEGEFLLFGSMKTVQGILRSFSYGGFEDRVRAAREVRRLTKKSNKWRTCLGSAGVITPLVSMLQSADMEAKEAALLALLNLAVRNERNKVAIVKAGAVAPLVELLGLDGNPEDLIIRESAAAAILTLSASNANKLIIGSAGAIPFLVRTIKHKGEAGGVSLQGKVDSVMALYNLCTNPLNLQPAMVAGAVPLLLQLLKSSVNKTSKIAEKSATLLEMFARFGEEGKSAIAAEEGGILTLVEVLEEGSMESKEHAVGALLSMCQTGKPKYKQAILQEGAIPGLLELTVQGTPRSQHNARTLLCLLRESTPSSSSTSPTMTTTTN